jgi:hypothetical protein
MCPAKPRRAGCDTDWSNLSAPAQPTPLRPASDGKHTSEQAKANLKQQAVGSRQTVQQLSLFVL